LNTIGQEQAERKQIQSVVHATFQDFSLPFQRALKDTTRRTTKQQLYLYVLFVISKENERSNV